jgi:hypothetical protein
VRGPDEVTFVHSSGESFVVRTEPAGIPQGLAAASQTLTEISLLWTRIVRRDRSWHIRVRRYVDDPAGPVLYHETATSSDDALQRLERLREVIATGRLPWADGA